ncbi:hypothetical protein [Trinickia dinghuensis]|uniref:HPt domain-containing protein n=1 Tax=Trinickia dinghuensis TaxID=2291023 RepID=A0A3D8JW73_9BURK|nr:hypothetical protein [Trinickia dinghuensis]RDU96955.1 hypothetical protein DWV00_20045 [Trinickia dinghuensis]
MPMVNRRAREMRGAQDACSFDLSELATLYGEAGLQTLLAVALDEFDCQHFAFDDAFHEAQWARAAHALHRLAGTAAFFVGDERMLEPLNRAERALRLADASLIGLAVPGARSTLAALRVAFVDERVKAGRAR